MKGPVDPADRAGLRGAGCTPEQYQILLGLSREAKAAGLPVRKRPLRSYQMAIQSARHRGVEWKLNAWEYWEIWRDSGHWHDRGLGARCYAMCRIGDVGAYEVGNVIIAPSTVNKSATANKRSGLPIGVFRHGSRFRARRIVDRVLIDLGIHDTAPAAHEAYLAAGPALDLTHYAELQSAIVHG